MYTTSRTFPASLAFPQPSHTNKWAKFGYVAMKSRKKPKTYVVFKGRNPGVYSSWPECEAQVKGYSGAVHKSYTTEEAANTAWQEFSKESAPPRPPVNSFTWSPSPPNLDISEDDEEPPLKKVKLSPEHGCSSQGSAGSIPFGNDEQQFKHEEPVKITPAQQAVVDMAQEGHNIFLTGAAGCGKTVTLKEIIRCLRKRFGNASFEHPSVQVIAPTGIAALPLDGKTTYSFAGWKPDSLQQPIEDLLEAAESKQSIQTRFHSLKVLIIEEVSMVENEFLERIKLCSTS
jgi:ATP-dependent DNA helicase PIF1